ncbi:MAG: hypothetical protein Q8M26_14860 [Pseudolabrys sp.]|nr:hypothetical protein [Pseudolabrys sp.]
MAALLDFKTEARDRVAHPLPLGEPGVIVADRRTQRGADTIDLVISAPLHGAPLRRIINPNYHR